MRSGQGSKIDQHRRATFIGSSIYYTMALNPRSSASPTVDRKQRSLMAAEDKRPLHIMAGDEGDEVDGLEVSLQYDAKLCFRQPPVEIL